MNSTNIEFQIFSKVKALVVATLALTLMACGGGGGAPSNTSASITAHSLSGTIDNISLSGPQFAMVSVAAQFTLDAASTSAITTATWNFGDGTAAVTGASPQSHIFFQTGVLTVTVTGTDSNGIALNFSQTITVIPYSENDICISDLTMSMPSQATVGQAVTGTFSVPLCLSAAITSINWAFGDGGTGTGTTVQYTYTTAGTYTVTATVTMNNGAAPFVFTSPIIVAAVVVPTPSPTPSPSPTPAPTPTGSNPHGDFCDCRHHFHWDFALAANFAPESPNSRDNDRDWAHDCKGWFDDHQDWYSHYTSFDKTCAAGNGQSDTTADQQSCHTHGHDGWDQDCDIWQFPTPTPSGTPTPTPTPTNPFGGVCAGTAGNTGAHEFFYNLTPIPDASGYAASTGKYSGEHLAASMNLFTADSLISNSNIDVCTSDIDIPMQSWSQGFPNNPSLQEWFGVCYDGSWTAPTSGAYTFVTAVDDAVAIWIDGKLVGENDDGTANYTVLAKNTGEPSSTNPIAFTPVTLSAGNHSVEIMYYQAWPVVLGVQVWSLPPSTKYTAGSTPAASSIMQLSSPINDVLNCPH
jgi:PKD repeat protein